MSAPIIIFITPYVALPEAINTQLQGYQLIHLADASQLPRHLSTEQPALLICSIDLATCDVWQLTRQIRAGFFPCNPTLPILLLSEDWHEASARISAREFGLNAVLGLQDLNRLPYLIERQLHQPEQVLISNSLLLVCQQLEPAIPSLLRPHFDLSVATGLEQAEQQLALKNYSLVLFDIDESDSQLEVWIETLLSQASHPETVLCLPEQDLPVAQRLMAKGLSDFIIKPEGFDWILPICKRSLLRHSQLEAYRLCRQQIDQKSRAIQQRQQGELLHQRLLNNLRTVVIKLNAQGQMLFLNQTWQRLLGHSLESSLNRRLTDYLATEEQSKVSLFHSHLQQLFQGQIRNFNLELRMRHQDGRSLWVELKIDALTDHHQLPLEATACLDNITERRQTQQQIEYLAMHDPLTDLYNRNYFNNMIRHLAATASERSPHALLYLDLDHFKVINDSVGHSEGDRVIKEISGLLQKRLRRSDTLCRLGGDEFALLLTNIERHAAERIGHELKELLSIYSWQSQGQIFNLSCSMGLCMIDGSANQPEEYLMKADSALYVAKQRGRNRLHHYDPLDTESQELKNSMHWVRAFRQAKAERRLALHFQPVCHTQGDGIEYYEALIRLYSTDGAMASPAEFLPALEKAGAMLELDYWVIEQAIRMLRDYDKLHRIGINLSAKAFDDPPLLGFIEQQILQTCVDPGRIVFELTESASLINLDVTRQMVEKLHQLGCGFAIDDFGSGFSTFSYLKHLPADYIKLDGSFVRNMDQNLVDQALVRSISDIANAMGKQTIAEFVENDTTLKLLQQIGIHCAQGYFFSKPKSIDELGLTLKAAKATSGKPTVPLTPAHLKSGSPNSEP